MQLPGARLRTRVIVISATLVVAAVIGLGMSRQQAMLRERNSDLIDPGGCTTAVIAGSATASGRPLLWKNRDRSIEDQEIVYFNDGPLDYITITNAGDSTQAWGGVNRAGFAIEDANNWNTPDTIAGDDDDGWIIKLALQTCRVVAEFQTILDSANVGGYTAPAIYGVIDTAGGAAMFETYTHSYIRYDAADSPTGVLVRSNWSYAGSTQGRIGVYRHDRAKALIEAAAAADTLDVEFMAAGVMRDLRTTSSFNPYPLPYEGQQGGLPVGWISTSGAICRRISVSALVIEGVLPDEDPLLTTMWAFPMAVQYGVMIPFWLAPHSTPSFVNGPVTAPLSDAGLRLRTFAQHFDGWQDTLDTYILNDGRGGGIHLTTFPLESYVFEQTLPLLNQWRAANAPDSAAMIALSTQLCDTVYERLAAWPQPGETMLAPGPVQQLTVSNRVDNGLRLRWLPPDTNVAGLPTVPATYAIFSATELLADPDLWTFLDRVTATEFVIAAGATDLRRFYFVRAEL
ncbi:hypothetical protein HZB60_10500 [candidate division KSB1 bacterium]|nr:hypothetical protein [candidate division KSB1 bacterium]